MTAFLLFVIRGAFRDNVRRSGQYHRDRLNFLTGSCMIRFRYVEAYRACRQTKTLTIESRCQCKTIQKQRSFQQSLESMAHTHTHTNERHSRSLDVDTITSFVGREEFVFLDVVALGIVDSVLPSCRNRGMRDVAASLPALDEVLLVQTVRGRQHHNEV